MKYQSKRDYVAANFASRTMRWTGVIVALFLIFHLIDLTSGPANPDFVRGDVYRQPRRQLRAVAGRDHLHRRQPRAGLPHLPRRLEHVPEPRAGTTRGFNTGPPVVRHRVRGGGRPSATSACRLLVVDRGGRMSVDAVVLDAHVPAGPIAEKWDQHKFDVKLVNPANKRKFTIIVVGSGLAGAVGRGVARRARLPGEAFCFQDSPRRAHSIAAQGGINAAKNYRNDGDSVHRLFYDTIKGGDYRSREANVYRLAQLSVNIIDQCVAQGVPVRPRVRRPARQPVVRWRAGDPHVLRPRPDRPAAAARRVPGARPPGAPRQRRDAPAHRDARPRREGRPRRSASSRGT